MLCAVNSAVRRQRRRLVMLVVMVGLAGAVVTAHSVLGGDHMSDGVVMCLAVAETAVIAVGTAGAAGLGLARRVRWLIGVPALREFAYAPPPQSVPARGSAAAAGLPALSSRV